MKITVAPKKEKTIPYNEIAPGQVYQPQNSSVIALKLHEDNAVLLQRSDSTDYLVVACGFKNVPASKILGQIKEIIVE